MNQSKKGFIRCFIFRLNLFSVIHIVAFINSFSIGCFGHEHFSWIVQKKKKNYILYLFHSFLDILFLEIYL